MKKEQLREEFPNLEDAPPLDITTPIEYPKPVEDLILQLLKDCEESKEICPSLVKSVVYNGKSYRIRVTKALDDKFTAPTELGFDVKL